MNNNYYWSLITASKKKLPPIWVEYIVARAGDFSLPAYDTMQENIVADTDHLASVQLYDSNNELVANFRPCLSTEKGHYLEGCLYDVVKEKFYYSQNADVKYGDIVREVEYIESTGTQYIDTNIAGDLQTKWSFRGRYTVYSTSLGTAQFMGAYNYSPAGRFEMSLGSTNVFYGNIGPNFTSGDSGDLKIHTFILDAPNKHFIIDDKSFNINQMSPIPTRSLYLLARHNPDSIVLYCHFQMNWCQIAKSNVLLIDYIPCILADGTVCMWDWISGEAKKNAGTGEFIAGKDMNDLFNIVEKEDVFLNRTTGDGLNVKDKSLAHITSLKGNTLVWNQMVRNGDLKNEMSGFGIDNATIHMVEDGIQIIQGNSAYGGFLYLSFNYTDHKYYISTICRSGGDVTSLCGISFLNEGLIRTNPVAYNNYQTVFTKCSTVGYLDRGVTRLALRVGDSTTSGKNAFGIFKTFVCIDLTKMFGAGNEPATAEEFEAMFPADYYDYDAGSLLNVDAGGIKSTDVGKTKWDSLYFVDNTHTLSSLTGKAEGSSVSEVIFPEGMKRIEDVYDELTDVKDGCFTKAVKRIGVRAYQTGDEDDTTVKTDGTNTYYTLSNATVYTLDTPVPCNYKVWKGGSEIVIPENTEALTAPVDMSVKYIVDVDE